MGTNTDFPDEETTDQTQAKMDEDITVGVAASASFGEAVKELLQGLNWGVKWFVASFAWGLCLFALFLLIGYALLEGPIQRVGPYYGLIAVVGLMTIILSVLRRRY